MMHLPRLDLSNLHRTGLLPISNTLASKSVTLALHLELPIWGFLQQLLFIHNSPDQLRDTFLRERRSDGR